MRTFTVLSNFAAIIALAGCGGSGKVASSGARHAADARSEAQLIVRADAICQRLNAEFAADEPKSAAVAETARIVPHRAMLEQKVVAELGDLKAPAAIAPTLVRIIAYRKALARELAVLALDAKRGDVAAIQLLAASKARLHRKLLAAAKSARLDPCGHTGRA